MSNESSLLQKFHFSIKVAWAWTYFSGAVFAEFFQLSFFSCNMTETGQISLTDCVSFPSYSVKCISSVMLRHLMTS